MLCLNQEKGTCPLHVAAGAGQASQVELLLVYGADPGGLDTAGKTPIDHARFDTFSGLIFFFQMVLISTVWNVY